MIKKLVVGLGIEFGPIIVFFLTAERMNFLKATGIFVILSFVSLIVAFYSQRRIAWFPLIAGGSVIIFGLATVITDNPFFIIAKDTLYNGAFAVVLFAGLAYNKNLLKPLFQSLFAMTDKGWHILCFRWAVMFTLLAVTNEIARLNLSAEGWINYKAVATLATMIFALYQFKLSKATRLPNATPWGMRVIEKR